MKKYFTTPIYYVNDVPHIGHAYCTLATDTLARYWREKIGNKNVFFVTGTDENSQKTIDAAQSSGKDVFLYLDEMAHVWRTTWEQCGVSFDDFIRTTEDRHVQTVQSILQQMYDRGDIYKGIYKGLYCTGCETFLKESDLDENKHCPAHKRPPQEIEEENYFFKLSSYQDDLLDLYANNTELLYPEKRKNEVLRFIESGLDDISISREKAEFGISLPWDSSQKVYVWFDALLNYLTVVRDTKKESFWNSAHHVLGKDITKFHCIIWPAMLMSARLKCPEKMLAHGFFTVDGVKMSKSLGNVVSPLQLSEKYGNDALRSGLLSSFEFGNDGDFSISHFEDFYQKKLVSGFGNVTHRVLTLIHKFLDGKKPRVDTDYTLSVRKEYHRLIEHYKLKGVYDHFFQVVDFTNERLNQTEVWKLAKENPESAFLVFAELYQYIEFLSEMSVVLFPDAAQKLKIILGNEDSLKPSQYLFPSLE